MRLNRRVRNRTHGGVGGRGFRPSYSICCVLMVWKTNNSKQKEYEQFRKYLERREKCEKQREILGNNRNSYAKTDPGATLMRMKDDHMGNGQ